MRFFVYIPPWGLGFHQKKSQEKFSKEIISLHGFRPPEKSPKRNFHGKSFFCMVFVPRALKNEKSPFISDCLVLESE